MRQADDRVQLLRDSKNVVKIDYLILYIDFLDRNLNEFMIKHDP